MGRRAIIMFVYFTNFVKCPPAVIKGLAKHVLTDKELDQFAKEWSEIGQTLM
jgi:hypothetical protein